MSESHPFLKFMNKKIFLTSVLIGGTAFFAGCGGDTRVDAVAGIQLNLINDGTASVLGQTRSTFKPTSDDTITWGRNRDITADAHYNDHTYIDDVYSDYAPSDNGWYVINGEFPHEVQLDYREEGYICRVLGECN